MIYLISSNPKIIKLIKFIIYKILKIKSKSNPTIYVEKHPLTSSSDKSLHWAGRVNLSHDV